MWLPVCGSYRISSWVLFIGFLAVTSQIVGWGGRQDNLGTVYKCHLDFYELSVDLFIIMSLTVLFVILLVIRRQEGWQCSNL